VLVDACVWAGWSIAVGAAVHLVPNRLFGRDTVVTRTRAFERDGRVYEQLAIRRWKDHLPDAGALFERGGSKLAVGGRSSLAIDRYVLETRRAEYVHVAILLFAPVFAWWNPWPLTAAMAAYAIAANVPCIAIQRYNRARLTRVLMRRTIISEAVR
jgi:glycosyl-4,4'-diaponeurosporenoate acyltransferase